MVIKVDFDLAMTILAYNLYRLLALDLPGYENNTAVTLYEKFIQNSGSVNLNEEQAVVQLKKKRHHPVMMSALQALGNATVPWIHDRSLQIEIASNS